MYGGIAAAAAGARATDPRIQQADPRVKRPRVADPRVASAPGADLSAQIQATLQRLRPGAASSPAASASVVTGVPAPQADSLGNMLMDSLRGLMPAGDLAAVLQSSQAGQELHRAMQQGTGATTAVAQQPMMQQPQQLPFTAAAAAAATTPAQATPVIMPAKVRRIVQPPPKPVTLDDGSDDDDGVPHRLPPGFGAIPEDVVEQRARMREELRQRTMKSTQPCKFGRSCKKRDCPNLHQDGREIDAELNICAFGRKCKRKGCFYDHIDGREIDNDPSKAMCRLGDKCRRPDCLYDHPTTRDTILGPDFRICYFCHESGHISQDCAKNPDSWAFKPDLNQKALPAPTQ